MKRYIPMVGLLFAAVLTACGKNAVQDITGAVPSASIKFFNFGVNAPAVNFYSDATKMTAINSGTGIESTLGTGYGGVGAGGYYSGIVPGQHTLTGRISATTDNNLAISTVVSTIADGKAYSFYQSGFYNTTAKTVDAFVVQDDIPAVDNTVASVRFVNAISNSNPMTLYATNTTTAVEVPVGGAVAYKAAGGFTPLPNGVYDLNTRYAGSATNVVTRKGVSFSSGRVYTIGARGDITATSGTNAPVLDNTANR